MLSSDPLEGLKLNIPLTEYRFCLSRGCNGLIFLLTLILRGVWGLGDCSTLKTYTNIK